MVYNIQNKIINNIKKNVSGIKNIQYFTDRCAGQYKNCKNFCNLTYHSNDFELQATWNFLPLAMVSSPAMESVEP